MFKKILAKWKTYRSTVKFCCWLKDDNGKISFAKVTGIPCSEGYKVISHYSRMGQSPIIQEVMMSKEKFIQFYRDFA